MKQEHPAVHERLEHAPYVFGGAGPCSSSILVVRVNRVVSVLVVFEQVGNSSDTSE